jgi:hypothetical protein
LIAVCCGADSALSRRGAVSGGTLAVLYRAQNGVRLVKPVIRRGDFVAKQGGSVARHRRQVAVACDCIPSSSRRETRQGCLLALHHAFIAKITRLAEHGGVAAFGEDTVTGCLIAFGGSLIAVGRSLVAVGSRLVGIRPVLILIGARLLVPTRDRIREETALLLCLDRPVRGSHRKIV